MSTEIFKPGAGSRRVLLFFIWIERFVYVLAGLFLAGGALYLMFSTGLYIVANAFSEDMFVLVLHVLERVLLVFMLIELLHSIRIILRDQRLVIEPFLIIALIAAVRRILIVTVQAESALASPANFVPLLSELLVLVVLMAVIVWSISKIRCIEQVSKAKVETLAE